MRTIHKDHEPRSLWLHRRGGGTYSDYAQIDEARAALLAEQGHLCAYCMGRISLRRTQVEHWDSQSEHGERALDWDNLLGVCPGGNGVRGAVRHCDGSRGNQVLKVNPADREQRCERFVHYRPSGEIYSNDEEIQADLHEKLNLNLDALQKARKAVFDSALSRMLRGERGYWSRERVAEEIQRWQRRDGEGKLPEYCQVAIYVLEKKLAKRND